jgi:hypothetical protein
MGDRLPRFDYLRLFPRFISVNFTTRIWNS